MVPTIFGYLVFGPLAQEFCPKYQLVSERPLNGEISLVTNEHLSKLLKQSFTCESKFLQEGVDKATLSKDEIYALQFFQNTYEILPHPSPGQSTVYNTETPQDWPDMNPKYIFQVKLNKKQCGGKLRKQVDSILHRFYNLERKLALSKNAEMSIKYHEKVKKENICFRRHCSPFEVHTRSFKSRI